MKREPFVLTTSMFLLSFCVVVLLIVTNMQFGEKISFEAEVNPEIVNGLITVSGIIFGFQSTFFKKPRVREFMFYFLIILIVEAIILGFTGYSYLFNTLEFGYLSTSTLMVAYGSLTLNLAQTMIFLGFDSLEVLIVHTARDEKTEKPSTKILTPEGKEGTT